MGSEVYPHGVLKTRLLVVFPQGLNVMTEFPRAVLAADECIHMMVV